MATQGMTPRRKRRRLSVRRLLSLARSALVAAFILALTTGGNAQNLINTGQINNTGTIRVQNLAIGLPDTIGGLFEFFGADQPVPARQYNTLSLRGSGTKLTEEGNFSVMNDIAIAEGVSLRVHQTSVITLGGNLQEQGYLAGSVQKSVNLSGLADSSDFGRIGITLFWSGNEPGLTTARRTSDSALTGQNDNQSIKRFFSIAPTTNSGLGATLIFSYNNRELNGHDSTKLLLWRSIDGGTTWVNEGGTVESQSRTITRSSLATLAGIWTAADSANALGPFRRRAALVAALSGRGQVDTIGRTLEPFVVGVTDSSGVPVDSETVVFSVTGVPTGATGYSLSTLSALSDSAGEARTTLTLGNKTGLYTVEAVVANLTPVDFTATAVPDVPALVEATSGGNQRGIISTTLSQPFVATITDTADNVVPNAQVVFAITNVPSGALGQSLSVDTTFTDSLGRVQSLLTLGNKVGTYGVSATATALPDSPASFTAEALHGPAAAIAMLYGNNQFARIGTPLAEPFVVAVLDAGENPVPGVTATFAISSVPAGAVGQSLSATSVPTDTAGRASSVLTLGNKTGEYSVIAAFLDAEGKRIPIRFVEISAGDGVGSLSLTARMALRNSIEADSVIFRATALPGAPASVAQVSGDGQSAPITTPLAEPFVITVLDTAENLVPNAQIVFAITNVPSGALGQSLSIDTTFTDSLGRAQSLLTLGNKVGIYTVSASILTAEGRRVPVRFTEVVRRTTATERDYVARMLESTTTASDSVLFTATATHGAPVVFALVSGNNQSSTILTQLTEPFVVTVLDAGENPVPGITATFAISSIPAEATGQSLSATSVPTDTAGRASSVLTLGNKVGQYSVAATSAGLVGSPRVFVATATAGNPAVITEVSGNNQTAPVLTILNPFVVVIRDSGDNPVPNALVTFTFTSVPPGATGQRLSVSTIATDDSGRAYSVLTLGNTVGTYSVTVTSSQLSSQQILFSSQALPGTPAILSEVSGNGQSAPINRPLTNPFIVVVRDSSNNPIPGVSIQFTITAVPQGATGQNLSTLSATTNENGFASTLFTLGNKVGTYVVTTSSPALPGVQTIFNALATRGTPAVLAQVSGNNQDTSINTQLANPFVIAIKDSGENPIPGIIATFTIDDVPTNATGQFLSDTSTVTDSLGEARNMFTLGNKVGTYTVSASFFSQEGSRIPITFVKEVQRSVSARSEQYAGRAFTARLSAVLVADVTEPRDLNTGTADSVLFIATATHGVPTGITSTSGDNQIGYIGDPLDTPFVVTVTDLGGNPVPGAQVQFSIIVTPPNAAGQTLSVNNVLTDSVGQASTILTVGDSVGTYAVRASAVALPETSLVFTAYTTVFLGDPNNDREANVADLTAIIDHILGRQVLTGTAFIRADINSNGRVNIRDAVLLVNYILYDTWYTTSTPAPYGRPRTTSTYSASSQANIQATFEVSPLGLRFKLTNDVAVKGIQIVLQLRQTVHLDSANYIFPRGLAMTVPATSDSLGKVRVLAFNFENKEIEAGQGAVFRLPIYVADTTQFEIIDVIVSALDNTGLRIPATKTMPAAEQYPAAYKLEQNYPNPFNSGTTIRYEIPDRMYAIRHIEIEIFNILGQKVKTLVSGPHDAGRFTVTWNGTNNAGSILPSGVYFYRIVSWDFVSSKKMILLK